MADNSKITRRRYLKYAAAGMAAAAVAGFGYYATGLVPTGTQITLAQTRTSSLNLHAPTAELETNPKYMAALEGQPVQLSGELADEDRDDLEYTLLVNNRTVSQGTAHYAGGYQRLSYITKPGDLNLGANSAVLTASDGLYPASNAKELYVDKMTGYPDKQLNVPIKGICYTVEVPAFSQKPFSHEQMEIHLTTIRKELCDSVRLIGYDVDLLVESAKIAMELDFVRIQLSPYWANDTVKETIHKMDSFVKVANELQASSDAVYLNAVEEPSLTPVGIIDDNPDWTERTKVISKNWPGKAWRKKLEDFLKELIPVARSFNGDLGCGIGVPWEYDVIDWTPILKNLDFIGGSHHWYSGNPPPDYGDIRDPNNGYIQRIRYLREAADQKPFHITEFGVESYPGGWQYAGTGHLYNKGGYDEEEQVRGFDSYCDLFNLANRHDQIIDACYLYEFCDNEPTVSQNEYGITRVVNTGEYLVTEFILSRKEGYWKWASLRSASPH